MHNPKHIHSRDFQYRQGIQNYYIIFIRPKNLYNIIIIGYYNQNMIYICLYYKKNHVMCLYLLKHRSLEEQMNFLSNSKLV
jgi:hypothetical protein